VTFDLLDWPDYVALVTIGGLGVYLVVDIAREVWRHRDRD
jgi:hypothetical protein